MVKWEPRTRTDSHWPLLIKENDLRVKLNLDLVVVKDVRATAKCGYEFRRFGSHEQLGSHWPDFHETSPFFEKLPR
jgi:hypothetical protein